VKNDEVCGSATILKERIWGRLGHGNVAIHCRVFTGGKALIAPVYDPGPTKHWTKSGSVPIVQSILRKVKTNEIVLQLGLKGHSKELSVPCSDAVDSSARYIRLCQGNLPSVVPQT
jgi:hypothetical protein